MTPLKRIAQLSAAFLGSNLARAAIAFGLSLALGRALGAEGFGRWILCTTWASTLTVVADLGFGVLLTRDGARPDAEAGRLVSGALLVRLAVVVPLGAILFAAASRVSADAESIAGLRVAALLGMTSAAYGCFGAILRSQSRWLPTVLGIETGWLAVQLAASWWLVHTKAGWAGWAGWAGSAGAAWEGGAGRAGGAGEVGVVPLLVLATGLQLAQIASAAVLWRTVFGDRGTMQILSPGALVALVRRAWPFALSGIVANLQTRVAPLMLGYLSTQAELGLFGAASRVGRVARLAPQAMFAGALPVLSNEYGRDRGEAQRIFLTLDRALLALGVGTAASCLLLAAPFLGAVFGPSFVRAAPALILVGLGLIPALSNSGRKVFLYAAGGESLVVRWSAAGLILQVVSGAVLIPALGSAGAAVSVLVSEAAVWLPLRRAVPQRREGFVAAPAAGATILRT
jgi:O-antigen/teichoic acid export membrane protein